MIAEPTAGRRQRLEERIALADLLFHRTCPCGRPDWYVVGTRIRMRYLRCRSCGRRAKVTVN